MNPAIDSRSGGGRLGRSAWLLLAACALFAVWTVAARPAGGFVVVQDSEPPPFDDGLNQEERELINRPISALTPEERKLRDEYLNKMKEHLVKMMKAKEKEWKKQGLQPGGKKPTTRKPGRKRVEPSKEETPKRPPTARPRKMFTPPPEELPEVPEDNDLLPFDERLYSFSLKNGNYHDLVEMFALYSGLSVMGLPVERLGGEDPADDVITFISARLTDFRATLHQINDLLFYEVSPPLYLYYNTDEHRLELDMFKELRLKLPPSRLFTSLEAVDLAVARDQLMGSDIVRVFFAPESAMKVFNEVVSGMFGEWVLMRIVEGTGLVDYTGRVDILDRIRDYLKRFDDWDQFEGDLHEIPVEFIKPSEALETLRLLVDDLITGTSEAKSRPRTTRKGRSGKDAGLQLESESVLVIAHDGHKVLLVKGLPYKVNEVKKIVDWIDRPTPEDPRDMPVVVKLQNAKAEDVAATLDALINGGSGVPIAPKKGRRAAAPRGMTGEKELLVIIPDSQNNALFLQGPEELITLAQSIIKEHLDIKRETGFRKVEIKFGDPAEIVAKVESLLGPRPKGDRGGKPLQIEVIGNALILRGDQAEMSEAELLIAEFDGDQSEEQETTFVAHLKNAKPSEVVDYLTTLAASRFEPSAKGRSKTRKPRAGNYLADDASSTIVFYGTEREWLNKILPVIETLDEELTQPEGGIVFVELKYADPVSVVSLMNQMLPPAKRGDPAGPKFAPAPRGVIISGLTSKTEEKSIRTMIELMDADPYDAEAFERRIFKLAHAEPEDVEDAIMTMFGSTGGAPAGRKPKGGGARGSGGIRMAITSGGLIITAPKDKMPEIAELIGQLDSEETSVTFIHRIFELENADPEKVEAEIHNLHGKVGGGKGRPRAGKAGEMDKDTIRTSTSSKGIFVIATEEKMTRIAEQVQTMEEHAGRNPVMTRRFDVIYVDAEVLVERLRPMLEIKLADSRSRGKGSGSKRAGSSMLSLQANAQTSSIYVVAPRDIIEEAAKTIALLDQEEADVETVHEIYECVNAHADDLAMLLNAVYSGGSTLPSTKGKSKRAGTAAERDRILRKLSGSNADDVEILALPGGKALLISGTREKVDETLARARQIDDKSIPTDEDRVTRTFTLRFADVDSVADGIIEMLGDPVRGKSAPKAGTGMMDMWDLESGPRRAGDISVWPRYATSTLMVVAPQDRMVAIEGFIDQCEQLADPDNTEFQAQPQPFEFYKPKYLSAYEIVSTTRSVMDTVYKVALPVDLDYLDKNTVVLKGTRRYFEEVRDLIEKYVDTADNVGPAELVFSFLAAPPPNVDLTQVMEMIGTFMPDMDIEVQNMSEGVGGLVGSNIPEIPAKNEK